VPPDPADPAGQAYRGRIRARFAELHDEREQLEAKLKTLAKTAPHAPDTTLLDRLPLPGDVLPEMPPQIKARLFAIFDVSIFWNKTGRQGTVRAEITEATLQAVEALLDPTQDGFHDTCPDQPEEPVGHPTNTPRWMRVCHIGKVHRVFIIAPIRCSALALGWMSKCSVVSTLSWPRTWEMLGSSRGSVSRASLANW
jgi:hypothetical protein